jgi:hypothetical protein
MFGNEHLVPLNCIEIPVNDIGTLIALQEGESAVKENPHEKSRSNNSYYPHPICCDV